MRIVQLLPSMHVGGVERGVVELSRALRAHAADSIVISRRGALCDDIISGGGNHIEFDCGSKNIFTLPARARRLRAVLREVAPDIVHVRSRVPAWLLRFAGGRHTVVSTFHGIYRVSPYSAQMTRADAVICPGSAVRAHILQHYRIAEEKLYLIPRGVDQQYFSPQQTDQAYCAQLRERLQLSERTIFAIVGRVSALKGHALFLQAFAYLLSTAKFAKPPLALIVGNDEGTRTARLRRLAQSLGISEAVRFAGVIRQMREVYALSDVVVSASTKPEAFGRTVAEAITMQRAAVAPAHGGALDIIRNGDNGVLFRPGDSAALAQAMQQAAALERAHLRDSVAEFSSQRMAAQTLAVYQQVLRAGE